MKKRIKVSMKTRELPERSIVWQERKKMLWKEYFSLLAHGKSEDHDIAETAVIFNN